MRFRRFNDQGLKAFAAYLDVLRAHPSTPVPRRLLEDPDLTSQLEPAVQAEPQLFATRWDFVCWLDEAANRAGAEIPRRDAGFWGWLTLALFDSVCPARGGKRKVGENARYLPRFEDWKRRYRHLLASPYNVYSIHKSHPGRVSFLLNSPLDVLGELTEQFASRQEFISCPGTMALASYLFSDPVTGHRKKSASGEAARRLGKLLNQYQRTWDITVMHPDASAAILPREFNKFIAQPSGARSS